ncbi:MAG: VCBS repeat-containing protein, partial [Bacteroidota bacterium]
MLSNFTYLLSCFLLFLITIPAIAQFGGKQTVAQDIPNEKFEISADLNQDGFIDLVMARTDSDGSEKHYIRFNDGKNNFTEEKLIREDKTEWTQIEPADFDQDGDLDLAVYQGEKGKVAWLENDGKFNFKWRRDIASNAPGKFIVAQFTGDKAPDVMAGNVLYQNDGTGFFTEKARLTDEVTTWHLAVDTDNDGQTEMVTYNKFYRYNDDSGFSEAAMFYEGEYEENFRSVFELLDIDVNRDGLIDFAIASTEGLFGDASSSVTIVENLGNNAFKLFASSNINSDSNDLFAYTNDPFKTAYVADYNGDSYDD